MDSDQLNFKALRKEVDMLESQLSECKRKKEEEEDSKQPDSLLYSGETSNCIGSNLISPRTEG